MSLWGTELARKPTNQPIRTQPAFCKFTLRTQNRTLSLTGSWCTQKPQRGQFSRGHMGKSQLPGRSQKAGCSGLGPLDVALTRVRVNQPICSQQVCVCGGGGICYSHSHFCEWSDQPDTAFALQADRLVLHPLFLDLLFVFPLRLWLR